MNSCIYEGRVRHRRYAPRRHVFEYSLFMMYLDLAELDALFDGRLLWSQRRAAPARFRRSDYLGDPRIALPDAVSRLVEERTGAPCEGPIRLLTHPRYFGYGFNPVSLYFCFDTEGRSLRTIVAEVSNTPWGERHCYVLDGATNLGRGEKRRHEFRKDFHVSPFMDMDVDYRWYFTPPGRSLGIHMENLKSGKRFFDATLALTRREISTVSLNAVLLRYPLMTARIVAAIYWHALLLWIKGTPFFTHPAKLNPESRLK